MYACTCSSCHIFPFYSQRKGTELLVCPKVKIVSRLCVHLYPCPCIIHMYLRTSLLAPGAVLGNPDGPCREKVILTNVTQVQILDAQRMHDTPEKLAIALLLLLFTETELSHGNCTKPVLGDIKQLDSERLWAIKCKKIFSRETSHLHLHGRARSRNDAKTCINSRTTFGAIVR